MVVQVGSMAIKGIFKAGSMLSGLKGTSSELKTIQQRGKSTRTEMGRMTKQSHLLAKGLGAIGAIGFSALLMQTPQLASALAKIKTEMMLIAYAVGKHLKPALDSVATLLHGIRTGDWAIVKQGITDLKNALVGLAIKAIDVILNPIIGEEATKKVKTDFNNWLNDVWEKANKEGGYSFLKALIYEPLKWVWDNRAGILSTLDDIGMAVKKIPVIGHILGMQTFRDRNIKWGGGKSGGHGFGGSYQVGGAVPTTGMYHLHAGETVTSAGSHNIGTSGATHIVVDFSGAHINLASGIELDQFADAISARIAEKQQSITY